MLGDMSANSQVMEGCSEKSFESSWWLT